MGKFNICKFLHAIDEIEHNELRPLLNKKCCHCNSKKQKEKCPPKRH